MISTIIDILDSEGGFPTRLQLWNLDKKNNNTVYFTASFRCLRVNKSALETTETKHTDSQLCFAPKIIKIHLVIFESELIEDAMLVPKKFQNRKSMFYSCMKVS